MPEYSSEQPGLSGLAVKDDASTLDGYLVSTGSAQRVGNTKTVLRTHTIPCDVNDHFLESKLAQFLSNLVTDYCIPLDARKAASEEARVNYSGEAFNRLRAEAVDLLVDSETSGEVGELLLYLLTERVVGAPQIISKMNLKTNSNVHYHGADGIHAKPTEKGLALYWGESKMHQDRAGAVRECLQSVSPYLTDATRTSAMRDLRLTRDNLDVDGKELKDQIVRFFIQEKPEWNRLEFRASCLVGFDMKDYPRFVDASDVQEDHKIFDDIAEWSKHLSDNVVSSQLEKFQIDFFLVPFRDVNDFRQLVLDYLGVG